MTIATGLSYLFAFGLSLGAAGAAMAQDAAPETPGTLPPATQISACNDYIIQYQTVSLTPTQRACLYLNNLFSPTAVFGAAFSSIYAQATNDEPSWGQGSEGYAKRFGARYVQGMSKATGEYLTGLVHGEDLRPTRSTCKSWRRIWCAAETLVVANTSTGRHPVFAHVAGAFADGFVGMGFYSQDPTWGQSLKRTGTSLASSLGYIEFYEFEPQIFGWLTKRFSPKSTAVQAGASSQPGGAR
jgi:hypothetical protein